MLQATSLDLSDYVILGQMALGHYRLTLFNPVIPTECPVGIVYVTCLLKKALKFADMDKKKEIHFLLRINGNVNDYEWETQLLQFAHQNHQCYNFSKKSRTSPHSLCQKKTFLRNVASKLLIKKIASDFANNFMPENFENAGYDTLRKCE